MKTYCSTQTVEAIQVKYLQGNMVSDKKKPKEKDLVGLEPAFVNHHTIHIDDWITFQGHQPVAVFSEAAFEASYEEHNKPEPITEDAE